jgi:hypothetical protein
MARFKDPVGFTVWTYSSDDGAVTEDVFNPTPGGVVPEFLLSQDGLTQMTLDPESGKHRGKGWTPPAGMRSVVPYVPVPDHSKPQHVELGWPGMVDVV